MDLRSQFTNVLEDDKGESFVTKGVEVLEKKINIDKNEVTTIITTNAPDRDNDIVEPDGANLKDFKNNPIMFFNHDYYHPIGKWLRTKKVNLEKGLRGIEGVVKFSEISEEAQLLFGLMKEGILNAFSIGFIPIDFEKREGFENDWGGFHIKKWILLEASLVGVPANPTATQHQKLMKQIKENTPSKFYEKFNPLHAYDQKIEDMLKWKEDFENRVLNIEQEIDEKAPTNEGDSGLNGLSDFDKTVKELETIIKGN